METAPNCRQISRLASRGRYLDADEAQQRKKELKEAHTAAERRRLEEDQAAQWLAFNRAWGVATEREAAAALAREAHHATLLERRVEEGRQTRHEELEAFVHREETLLARRPVAHSQRYVETKRAETQLAQQGRFRAAETARVQAAHLASLEYCAAEAENQRRLTEKVRRWEDAAATKEHNALRTWHAKHLREETKASRRAAAEQARLARMQANMAAVHERQHRELDTLGHVRAGCGAPLCTATRGTRLERRVITEQQKLPSLCEMYGHLLV